MTRRPLTLRVWVGGLLLAIVSHGILKAIGVSYYWIRLPAVMLILAVWLDYAERLRHG